MIKLEETRPHPRSSTLVQSCKVIQSKKPPPASNDDIGNLCAQPSSRLWVFVNALQPEEQKTTPTVVAYEEETKINLVLVEALKRKTRAYIEEKL
jgi:hypothetical protein